MSCSPTIYVLDDDPSALASICSLLSAHNLHSMAFPSAEEFIAQVTPDAVGCVVTDFRMSGADGLALQKQLRDSGIRLPVILVSGYATVPIALQAMESGAVTVLEKPFRAAELLAAIERALDLNERQRQQAERLAAFARTLDSLAPSEVQILPLLLVGKLNKMIARELDVGLRSVERARQRLFEKLGAESVAQLSRILAEYRALAQELGFDLHPAAGAPAPPVDDPPQ